MPKGEGKKVGATAYIAARKDGGPQNGQQTGKSKRRKENLGSDNFQRSLNTQRDENIAI